MIHLEEELMPGSLPTVSVKKIIDNNLYVIDETGEEIINLKDHVDVNNKNHFVPLFEIADTITIKKNNFMNLVKELDATVKNFRKDKYKKFRELNIENVLTLVRTPLTFIPVFGTPQGPTSECETINDLLLQVFNHVCCTDRKILSYDNPQRNCIGFACECGKIWQINMSNFKKDKDDKIKSYFENKDSRNSLAEQLTQRDSSLNIPKSLSQKDEEQGHGIGENKINIFEAIGMIGWNGSIETLIPLL